MLLVMLLVMLLHVEIICKTRLILLLFWYFFGVIYCNRQKEVKDWSILIAIELERYNMYVCVCTYIDRLYRERPSMSTELPGTFFLPLIRYYFINKYVVILLLYSKNYRRLGTTPKKTLPHPRTHRYGFH